jgi:hypothetical protein
MTGKTFSMIVVTGTRGASKACLCLPVKTVERTTVDIDNFPLAPGGWTPLIQLNY